MQLGMLRQALEKKIKKLTTSFHEANMLHLEPLMESVIYSSRPRPALATLARLGNCVAAVLCAIHGCIASVRALGVRVLGWQWQWMRAIVCRPARRNTDTRMKMVEVAPWWCSGVTRNLPENVFPANTRDRATLQEQPVEGPGPSFNGTLLFVVFFSIDLCFQVRGYHSTNPDNILFWECQVHP